MNTTKKKIVKTALKLFLQKGFHNVSMNQIAAEIGISKPAIYYHFKNKDDMVEGVLAYFSEVLDDWNKKYFADLESGQDFIERLFYAIPVFKDIETILLEESAESYPYSYNDLLMTLSKYKPEFQEKIAQDKMKLRQIIKQQISEAQNANLIRTDLQPSRLAIMIHTIIEGTAYVCELDPKLKVDRVTEDVYTIIKKVIGSGR